MTDEAGMLSWQQRQAEISVRQFEECLLILGWVPNKTSIDLGEDILVNIYFDAQWTGITFFTQLKSTEHLEEYVLDNGLISYPAEVGHLKRWNQFATPVVFVLWDIATRRGYWATIKEIINELEQRVNGWQQQTTVQIHINQSNIISIEEGYGRLRHLLATYSYPNIAEGRDLNLAVRVVFPPTPAGDALREAYRRFYETGEPIEIDGEFIEEFKYSDWHTRLYGEVNPKGMWLRIEPRVGDRSIPTRLDLILSDDTIVSLPYLDVRIVKQGAIELTASNQHQPIPIHMTFGFNFADLTFGLSLELGKPGVHVQDTRDAITFLQAISKGGNLWLTNLEVGDPAELGQATYIPDIDFDPEYITLIEKLCLIQRKCRKRLMLTDWEISAELKKVINEVTEIIDTGQVILTDSIMLPTFRKPAMELALQALRTGQGVRHHTEGAESVSNILDVEIPLGPATWDIVGIPMIPIEELEKIISEMGPEDERSIEFRVLQGTGVFDNWIKR
jgi:hypothetical protein